MLITVAFLAFIGVPMLLLLFNVGGAVAGGSAAREPAAPARPAAKPSSHRPVTVVERTGRAPSPAPVPATLQAARAAQVVDFPSPQAPAADLRRRHAG